MQAEEDTGRHTAACRKNTNIMKVGVPKEIKNNECRVGMTPAGVAELVKRGHTVFVQNTAGIGSGFAAGIVHDIASSIWPD